MSGEKDIADELERLRSATRDLRNDVAKVNSDVSKLPSMVFVFSSIVGTFSLIMAIFWFPFSDLMEKNTDFILRDIARNRQQIDSLTASIYELDVELKVATGLNQVSSEDVSRILTLIEGRLRAATKGVDVLEFSGPLSEAIALEPSLSNYEVLTRYAILPEVEAGTISLTDSGSPPVTLIAPTNNALRSLPNEDFHPPDLTKQ